jgi:hypothetical protein
MTPRIADTVEEFCKAITEVVEPVGFRRAGFCWHRKVTEVIAVLVLERSRWDVRYYPTVGVHVPALSTKRISKPGLRQLHLWCRLSQLLPENESALLEKGIVFTEQQGQTEAQQRAAALRTIREVAVPFLTACLTLHGVARIASNYGPSRLVIYPELHSLLDTSSKQ